MRIANITSIIAFNTVMARFAPNHGKRGYRVEANGDVTLMSIENCDRCGREVEGANSVTMVKPRRFVMERLAYLVVARKIVQTDVEGEIGCNDDGDAICPECYAVEQAQMRAAE